MKVYDDYRALLADIGGSGARYLAEGPAEGYDVDKICRAFARHVGLDIQEQKLDGEYLLIAEDEEEGGGRKLGRSYLYGLAIAGCTDVRDCALEMIRLVHEKHGAGRVWVLDGMPHYIHDDGKAVCAPLEITFDGKQARAQHVLMRFIYGHEAQAVPL